MLFRFFFSDNIIEEILSCTNLQGRRAATQWNAIQREEFLVFVGMLLLAGIKKIRIWIHDNYSWTRNKILPTKLHLVSTDLKIYDVICNLMTREHGPRD